MHLIAVIGHHGVGKTSYVNSLQSNMKFATKVESCAFADTPKESVGEQFGIDVIHFHTDAKDKMFLHSDQMTEQQREVLLHEGEDKISYRQLLIRWTTWEKSQEDPLMYLRLFKLKIDKFRLADADFVLIHDLRLFSEYDFLQNYSYEVRVLHRDDFPEPAYSTLDSFDKEMVDLVKKYGKNFKYIDITRK